MRRLRALELQERMLRHRPIYHAAWRVRAAYFGPSGELENAASLLFDVVTVEIVRCEDRTGFLLALADALTASPHGLPWSD